MYMHLSIHLYIYRRKQSEKRAPGLLRQPGRSPYLDTLVITGGFFRARKLPFFVMAATFFALFLRPFVSEALGIDKAPTMW